MIDFVAYLIVRALNRILAFVPISASLWTGRRLGTAAFFFNKKRRLVAYANLKAAFAKEKSPAELRRITKRVYQNMVQTFIEVLNLTKINKKYYDKYDPVFGYKVIDQGWSPKLGNWWLSNSNKLIGQVFVYDEHFIDSYRYKMLNNF